MQLPGNERFSRCRTDIVSNAGNVEKCSFKRPGSPGRAADPDKRQPLSEEEEKKYKAAYLPLEKLLAVCDIISLHLPVTEETQGMCDKNFFEKMKEGSYFVNTSRGELVEDQALIHALQSGKLTMAALDTLSHEPVQKDHILLRQPEEIQNKLLFSPHIGGITASSFKRGYAAIWENVGRITRGEKPVNVVNGL